MTADVVFVRIAESVTSAVHIVDDEVKKQTLAVVAVVGGDFYLLPVVGLYRTTQCLMSSTDAAGAGCDLFATSSAFFGLLTLGVLLIRSVPDTGNCCARSAGNNSSYNDASE